MTTPFLWRGSRVTLIYPTRCLLRADGTTVELDRAVSVAEIEQLIGAETLDTVRLTDRVHVMVVDDDGYRKGLPLNKAATLHYWDRCGGPNDHCIVGDTVIVPDSDFVPKGGPFERHSGESR